MYKVWIKLDKDGDPQISLTYPGHWDISWKEMLLIPMPSDDAKPLMEYLNDHT